MPADSSQGAAAPQTNSPPNPIDEYIGDDDDQSLNLPAHDDADAKDGTQHPSETLIVRTSSNQNEPSVLQDRAEDKAAKGSPSV